MTNCRLPRPDWVLISHSIALANGEASTRNSVFKLFDVPLFYLPYLRHPVDDTGRESGLLIPVLSNSSIKGFVVGEQIYWAINRSMDMVAGVEYYTKRGWAPNGDFRYKGPGLDHLVVRWNALLDRGVEQQVGEPANGKIPRPTSRPNRMELVNQGGVDMAALGRKDLSPETRVAGIVEFLSSYVYRLVFNENYSQAVSSEVASELSLTHTRMGLFRRIAGQVPELCQFCQRRRSAYFASSQPAARRGGPAFGRFAFLWGLGSSIGLLNRTEP